MDFLDGLPDAGRLGLTLAPGKKGPSYYGGYWDRDLETDLHVLRDEIGVDVLVTLMEQDEMAAAQIPDLLQRAEARGFRVMHFPIEDTRAPMPGQEQAFRHVTRPPTSPIWKVGRPSPCIAAAGWDARAWWALASWRDWETSGEEAMARVRAARPGAIETFVQERYVMAYAERRPYGREVTP